MPNPLTQHRLLSLLILAGTILWHTGPLRLAAQDIVEPTTINLFQDGFRLWERLDGGSIDRVWELHENGELHLKKPIGRNGSLITKEDFGDFELTLEWRGPAGVNNGIKYRVRPFQRKMLGIEYQILTTVTNTAATHATGAIYDLFGPSTANNPTPIVQNPPMDWNQTRILVQDNRLEHWLNGTLLTTAEVGSDAWKEAIENSKHKQRPTIGMDPTGRIMLTDHKGELWFRNVRLRSLGADTVVPNIHLWNMEKLAKPPKFRWIDESSPIRSLAYSGEDYQGRKSEVFAFYATPGTLAGDPASDKNLPGIVLLHGGGGTAFAEWVELWARRGYAAIAMDLGGERPSAPRFDAESKLIHDLRRKREPLEAHGPADNQQEKFGNAGGDRTDDWQFHAVSAAIRAHSLLRNFKEVNANRTAVTGISWGGYLTCLVASIDDRFKAAVPVYGCGYLFDGESVQRPMITRLPDSQRSEWIRLYDPSSWLPKCKTPIMFVNGTKDKHYPLDSYAKSYSLVESPKQFQIDPQMGHSHPSGWRPPEIEMFVSQYIRNGVALPKIQTPSVIDGIVSATVVSDTRIEEGMLFFTSEEGTQSERTWQSLQANYADGLLKASLPKGATRCILGVRDSRQALVTSEVVFLD